MEVQVKGREYYGKSITFCFFFETDSQQSGFNSFLYGLGIGTGKIRNMQPGEKKSIDSQTPPDLEAMIGKSNTNTEYIAYDGHSLVGDCEPTKYIFILATIYINYKQSLSLQRNFNS